MIRKINLHNRAEAFALLDLQSVSYVVEARLIGFYDIPPLNDTFDTLKKSKETFYGYYVQQQLAGAISFIRDGDMLDIHRMMVHPDYFRKGIAGALLAFVEQVENGIRHIVVMTGTKNEPAKNLYKKHGFVETEQKEVVPGVPMTSFKKIVTE